VDKNDLIEILTTNMSADRIGDAQKELFRAVGMQINFDGGLTYWAADLDQDGAFSTTTGN
jgi:hypothetical protein